MNKSSLVSLILAGTVSASSGLAFAQGAPPVNPGAPAPPHGAAALAPAAVPAAPRPAAAPGPGAAAAPATPVVGPRGAPAPAPIAAPAPGGPGVATAPAAGGSLGLEGVTERTLPDRAPPKIDGLEPEAGGLTPSEVSRRAIAVRPSLKVKRAQLRAADEKITQTMIQFFPKLTIQAGYTRLSPVTSSLGGALVGAGIAGPLTTGPCPQGQPLGTCVFVGQDQRAVNQVGAQAFSFPTVQDNYSVSGRLAIPLSDYVLRVADASASSTASRDAARVSVEAERLKVDADSRALYFNWLRARGQASIARKSVEQTRARLEDAKASFAVGAISKAELLRIQALVANTELVLTRSESMVALTNGQLAIVMEDWHPNYHVGEGIPLPSTIPEETEPLDRLIAAAQTRRLEVQVMDATVRAYRRGGDATRAGALPR
ncbi:MAG TPA: TolC family protein, partial [Polyangiaceae bacterium]